MHKINWFDHSPDAGPGCLCSLCGEAIVDDVPVRLLHAAGLEARFHTPCFSKVSFAFYERPRRGAAIPYRYTNFNGEMVSVPVYWGDNPTFAMAVREYLDHMVIKTPISPDRLALVIDYLNHYIFAGCWFMIGITNLRLQADEMWTVEEVDAFIKACLEESIDPL